MKIPPTPIVVITRDLQNLDVPPREKFIDYGNDSDRKWLTGHCTWALTHNHSVYTRPTSDFLS